MIYLDTSAFVKKYFTNEKGHEQLLNILQSNSNALFCSALTYIEAHSALTRRRGDIRAYEETVKTLRDDWDGFNVWAIDDEVLSSSATLITQHCLRAADAIHLATALNIRKHLKESPLFVCNDSELGTAAKKEGLSIIEPT